MAQKMSQQKGAENTNLQFSAKVTPTDKTRVVSGFNTKQTIVTLTMEGTDTKSGNKGAMDFTMDMWMAPNIPGYEEVRGFYQRMGQKLAWNPSTGAMAAMMAQHAKGMSELMKEMSKLEGVPVLQITRLGGAGTGMPSDADIAAAQQQAQADQAQQTPAPTAQEAAGQAAAGAAASRAGRLGGLAGSLGGFGGFGRKKKTEEPPPAAPPAAASQPSAAPAAAGSPASLMEMTTELTSFSSAPVDGSKLQVPPGFKQVEHEMAKALK
jgi:hypothetical protein